MQQEQMTRHSLHFIEIDTQIRAENVRIGMSLGHHCELYSDLSELAVHPPRAGVVLVRDSFENGGMDFIMDRLMALGIFLPVVAMDYDPSPARVVDAVKAGALDYLAMPLKAERLTACLSRIARDADVVSESRRRTIDARQRLAALSGRERQVLDRLANGGSNKEIARELAISPRTVEIHRANMMMKLGARHSAEAIRLRMESDMDPVAIVS